MYKILHLAEENYDEATTAQQRLIEKQVILATRLLIDKLDIYTVDWSDTYMKK